MPLRDSGIAPVTRAGRGAVIVIRGEHIADWLKGATVGRNRIIRAQPAVSPAVMPYDPWLRVLQEYVCIASQFELQGQIQADAAIVAEYVPVLRERLPTLPRASYRFPQYAQARTTHALASFIVDASWNEELIIIIDRDQCTDRRSLDVLAWIGRMIETSKLLLVLT